MASPALVRTLVLTEHPWLIHKLTVTTGATAGTVAHGGPAVIPDIVFGVQTNANPTGGDYAVTAKSTTTITLDFEDDGNDTWDVYCIWFSCAAGGISV